MKSIICPISTVRVNSSVVRLTALLIASLVALYVYTGFIYLIMALSVDFFIRAFTSLQYSPASWLASQLVAALKLPHKPIDKAPKIFAARVGFLFSLAISALYFAHPLSSVVVSFILIGFALLEALFDICVGCLVYTYFVLPIFGQAQG